MSPPCCHPERRKYSGGIFSESNPTQGRARSGISARSVPQGRLSVGETCGLPRANTVRPYRALYNFSAKNITFYMSLFFIFMPISWYSPMKVHYLLRKSSVFEVNSVKETSQGFPLDPSAALALNASAVGITIKKQRADIP